MYRLGVDLGGTNIAVGVTDENFNIIGRAKVKTKAPRPAEEIADDIALAVRQAVSNAGLSVSDISSMGIGTPGAVDPKAGVVTYANNLGFYNVPLCQMMKERIGVDFYIENDANAATYGEYIAGAGKGTNNFIAITLGTGVGGGIVIDKKLYSGSNYAGGELGHTVINFDGEMCSCGRKGCFEAYASATALIRQTKAKMLEKKDSLMWKMVESIDKVSGLTAFDAWRKGDLAATEVVEQYIRYISIGVINMVNTFQPEKFCIGGGVSGEKENLIKPIVEYLKVEDYARNMDKRVEVCVAELGNDAGIIGAAFLDTLYK